MNNNLQAVSSAGHRRANKEEIEQAAMALRSVDSAVAGLIVTGSRIAPRHIILCIALEEAICMDGPDDREWSSFGAIHCFSRPF